MSQIRGVLFDLDDTLFEDRAATLAGLTALADAHLPKKARFAWDPDAGYRRNAELIAAAEPAVMSGETTLVEARRARFAELLEGWGAEDVDSAAALKRYRKAYTASWAAVDGAKATLKTLRDKGIRTGVLTNFLREDQWDKAEGVGLAKHLDVFLCAEDIPAPKPDRGAFTTACEALGTEPKHTVMVGDSLRADVTGALDAGLRAVWLARQRPDLALAKEVPTVADITELVDLLESW